MQTLTQDEILYIKKMYSDYIKNQSFMVLDNKIQTELALISDKYKPLLDKAAADGDIETRKSLIEEMANEARLKEEEIKATMLN